MSEIELKACPFCGGVPSGLHDYFDGRGEFRYVVNCTNDDCPTDYMIVGEDTTAESAAAKWNTRASQWQPIESAPKDGSEIHLCSERGQAVGYWDEDEDSFVTDYRGKGNFDFVAATYWQPLPPPPEAE